MITHYAQIAQEELTDIFNIGTELKKTTTRENDWRGIVEEVRSIFEGDLVYGANWDEADQIQWWDAMDYIGIDAYFPLTLFKDPSVDQLTHAWARRVDRLEALSEKWDRPIILTEVGYRSIDGANKAPYDYEKSGDIDLQEQADCYQAVFNAFKGKSWWHGVFFWSWTVDPQQGGPTDDSYTIHNKPAEQILLDAYQYFRKSNFAGIQVMLF